MGGQGKRVRIAVTPRCDTERAAAWCLFALRRSTGPVRRAWYDLTLRSPCGAPYAPRRASSFDADEQRSRSNLELLRELQHCAQIGFTAAVLVHADCCSIDFRVERKALL